MSWRRIGWGLLAVALVAQLIPVPRTNPPATGEISAPLEVDGVLQRACYDCHSRETRWPWYAWVAPASWLLAYDVAEARGELDFSTWTTYPVAKRRKMLGEIAEVLDDDEMPPWIYRPLHPDARLADTDKALVVRWAREERGRLRPTPRTNTER